MPIEAALASCIDALERGVSVESALAAYPEYETQLEPMLRIVELLYNASTPPTATPDAPSAPHQAFEAALAFCLAALEYQIDLATCLALFPHYAERLEPLLRVAVQQRQASPVYEPAFEAKLASQVHALIREHSTDATVTAEERYGARIQPLLRMAAKFSRNGQRPLVRAPNYVRSGEAASEVIGDAVGATPTSGPATLAPVSTGASGAHMPAWVARLGEPLAMFQPKRWSMRFAGPALVVTAALVLVTSLVLQTAALTMPGDLLYPIKRGSEEVQGVVVTIFGEPVYWHMGQVERRVQELARMEAASHPPDPELVEEVQEETEQALAAAKELPLATRAPLLAEWFRKLDAQSEASGENEAVASALAEPLATVESAAEDSEDLVALLPQATADVVARPDQAEAALPTTGPAQPQPAATSTTQLLMTQPVATATGIRATATVIPRSGGTAVAYVPTSTRPATTRQSPAASSAMNAAATQTATRTPTRTPTRTQTRTPIPTSSPTAFTIAGMTSTATPNVVATATRAVSAASPLLPTITSTPERTPTATPAQSSIILTPESADSLVPTVTPNPVTPTPVTPTPVPTTTPFPTDTPWSTSTATSLPTLAPTDAPTDTPEPTATATALPTNTPLPLAATSTPVPSNTTTPVPTNTSVPTNTTVPTDTPTLVPTDTPTLVPTNTPTSVPTVTWTPVPTNTPTPVPTNTPTSVPTDTPVPTVTWTPVPTNTPTPVPTDTPTLVPTNTPTSVPTDTPVPTVTWTPVPTNTPTPVPTNTPTPVPTNTPTPVPTNTPTPEPTNTPTPEPTNTPTPVPTDTPEPTETPTSVPTNTPTPTATGGGGTERVTPVSQ